MIDLIDCASWKTFWSETFFVGCVDLIILYLIRSICLLFGELYAPGISDPGMSSSPGTSSDPGTTNAAVTPASTVKSKTSKANDANRAIRGSIMREEAMKTFKHKLIYDVQAWW